MLIGDMALLVRQFVADRQGVHLLLQEPVISQLYVITGYSIPQFTAIRRILVSNLVSNAEPPRHVPPRPLGDTVYSSDLRLGFGYRQPAASACFSDT